MKDQSPDKSNGHELPFRYPILSPFDLKFPEEQQAVLNQIASILSTAALNIVKKEFRKRKHPKFDAKD